MIQELGVGMEVTSKFKVNPVGVGIVSCIHPGEDDSSGLVLGNPTWWSHQVKDVLIYSVVV